MLASIVNLDQPAHYVHWHFIQLSDANLAVMIAMLIVFALAILLPFPGARERSGGAASPATGGTGAAGSGGEADES